MFCGGSAWLNAMQNISGERQWKRKEIESIWILKRNESALTWEKGIARLFDNSWTRVQVSSCCCCCCCCSCPPEDTWYGVILWVLRVLGQGLNQIVRIFFSRVFSGCYAILTSQRGQNSCLWLQSRSVLSSFGVMFMSCRVNFHVGRSALQYSACRI